ncbi:MAG: YncE family protein [Firmicutes bacterium]|nr:YncE family protein [Bacillota bacterium]
MKEMLLVLNKDEHTVSYIETQTGQTLKTISVDQNPHEVAITRDGRRSYVTSSGGNSVSVFDNETLEMVGHITHPEFKFPHGVGLNSSEDTLWIASTYANTVFLIDTKEFKVRKTIPTYQELVHMIYFSPDRKKVYVPNIGSNNITLFDAESESIITHFPVGRGPEGAAAHPDGKRLFVANQDEDSLHIYNLDDLSLAVKLRLGRCPIRLIFSPDGRYALIPNREGDCVSVVDTNLQREIKRIPVGIWPGGTVFNAAGTVAWVANNKTNDISVIDVQSLQEVDRIPAGIHPDGIGYIPGDGE